MKRRKTKVRPWADDLPFVDGFRSSPYRLRLLPICTAQKIFDKFIAGR
jgi:hypothetical protein